MGLTENEKKVNSYGCVMIYINFDDFKGIQRKIEVDDIYIDPEDDSFGLESQPHVTLLYGLNKSVKDSEIKNIISSIDFSDITIELTKICLFEIDGYDVLKFDVGDNETLVDANKQLKKLPFTNDYPKFQPHMTIAYLNPGTGNKYTKLFKDLTFKDIKPTKIVYSKSDGTKINFKI